LTTQSSEATPVPAVLDKEEDLEDEFVMQEIEGWSYGGLREYVSMVWEKAQGVPAVTTSALSSSSRDLKTGAERVLQTQRVR
jgi:hypothetical protein